MISQTGSAWFSSYDILPAPLFTGAAQRCTIFIGRKGRHPAYHTTKMHRWRSSNRSSLFHLLHYTETPITSGGTSDIPRHYGENSRFLLEQIESAQTLSSNHYDPNLRRSSSNIQYAKAALNFVSVFLENPPLLDSKTLEPRTSTQIGSLLTPNDQSTGASLAATVGELYLWYWLTRGDGFHVTSGVLSSFLVMLNEVPDQHYKLVSAMGDILNERRNEALVFKHHAGQYVGNFNYRGFHRITRRADLLLLHGLNSPLELSIDLLDFMQRTLLVNEHAGEKGIPDYVRAMFPQERTNVARQLALIKDADNFIREAYGLTENELESILAPGYPQWPSVTD